MRKVRIMMHDAQADLQGRSSDEAMRSAVSVDRQGIEA